LFKMSYGGYEYNDRSYSAGFDPTAGYGNYDSAMGGGFMGGDDKKGSDKKASRDRQSLIPVSIKQVITCSHDDDTVRIDGAELNMIKLIGTVDGITDHETNSTFKLSDGSGSIDCKQFRDKGANNTSKPSKLNPGSLMRIIGVVKQYEGKLHIQVYDSTPVTDWNELTYHLLDIILVHCQQTKGPIPGSTGAPVAVVGGNSFGTPNNRSSGGQVNSAMNKGIGGVSLNNNMRNEATQNLSDMVYSVYTGQNPDSGGLAYQNALMLLQKRNINISMDQLVRTVSQLCDDGRLYSTIDENHYRPTGEDN